MSESRAREKLRPLGSLELYHYTRSKLQMYNGVAHTAQYVIPSEARERLAGLRAITFAALKTVVCRQPIMGVTVVAETSRTASWIRLNKIDLDAVTEFISIPNGLHFIEDEHQRPIELTGELPLWRIVIAQHDTPGVGSLETGSAGGITKDTVFDLGFFYCHAIGDGLSGAAFHVDFLDALNAALQQTAFSKLSLEPIVEVPRLGLLPNLEIAATFPLSIAFILWEIIKAFLIGNKDPKRWTGPTVTFSPENRPKTRMSTTILDSTTGSKLSALCRQNKATITPLLTVLIARNLADAYPTHSRFLGTVPIQLRRFTGVSARQMVDYVSAATVYYSTKSERGYVPCGLLDWEDVQTCKAVIDCATKSPANQITIMLRFVSNFEKFFLSKVGGVRSSSFEVSNVGLVDGGLDGPGVARFNRLVFSQSANTSGSPYVFSIASVKGGDMAIALTWEEGVLEEDKAEQVMESLKTELHLMALGFDLQKAENSNQ